MTTPPGSPSGPPPTPPYGQFPPSGQQPHYPPATHVVYVQSPGTSGLAIASLVLGILWLGGLGSLLATIFGGIALRQTRDGRQGGRGMAIAGLILGIVGLLGAVIAFSLAAAVTTSGGGSSVTCVGNC
jgi:hypothetical protein